MIRIFVLSMLLAGCAAFDNSPPDHIYKAWNKKGADYVQVKEDMKTCGYRDVVLANDLDEQEIVLVENCMQQEGYVLNMKSYRPNNCYGQRSPYLCNRLWGGKKPEMKKVGRD